MQGGRPRRRPRRERSGRAGWHGPALGALAFLSLLALAAVALVAYAAFYRPTSPGSSTVRLPNLAHAFQSAGDCPARAYPPGAKYSFERCVSGGTPIGWPRCSQVTYSVDATSAPPGYQPDIRQAIKAVAAATGLRLVPVAHGADIRISWDPSLYNPVPGSSGEAGETDYRTSSGFSGVHVELATVRISSHLATGASPGLGEVPVVLHELGHAVGLGHYSGPVVMNPVDRGFTGYQAGDLAGLAVLYHPATCPAR